MAGIEEIVNHIVETFPGNLREEHKKIAGILKEHAEKGGTIVIHADADPDGASVHGLVPILERLGAKVEVHHEDRRSVRFDKPGLHIVYDITVEPYHFEKEEPPASTTIINIDHHDNEVAEHPALVAIANPFKTDKDKILDKIRDTDRFYAYNPSIQSLHLAKRLGATREELENLALYSAIGAVGDKADENNPDVKNFVMNVAKYFGVQYEAFKRAALVFGLSEHFPGKFTEDRARELLKRSIESKNFNIILADPVAGELLRIIEPSLKKYEELFKNGEVDVDHHVETPKGRVRVIVLHIDDDDARRIMKLKSAVGSLMLDIVKDWKEPTVVAAGQYETDKEGNEWINYRVGANYAARELGLHAGKLCRVVGKKVGGSGGGHEPVGGLKVPVQEKERIRTHMEHGIRELLK